MSVFDDVSEAIATASMKLLACQVKGSIIIDLDPDDWLKFRDTANVRYVARWMHDGCVMVDGTVVRKSDQN